jgi:hypothetical protein
VDTGSRLAIFAIEEITMWCYDNWRPNRILYVGGVWTIVIPSVSIKDCTIASTSIEIECMPLT